MISSIDLESFNALKSLMGDDFDLLINTFIRDSDGRIQELASAMSMSDVDALSRAAHSLKGSSSNLGAVGLSDVCCKLEIKSKESNKDLEGLEQLCGRIAQEYNLVKAELEEYRV